jgi:hypothetical protein
MCSRDSHGMDLKLIQARSDRRVTLNQPPGFSFVFDHLPWRDQTEGLPLGQTAFGSSGRARPSAPDLDRSYPEQNSGAGDQPET